MQLSLYSTTSLSQLCMQLCMYNYCQYIVSIRTCRKAKPVKVKSQIFMYVYYIHMAIFNLATYVCTQYTCSYIKFQETQHLHTFVLRNINLKYSHYSQLTLLQLVVEAWGLRCIKIKHVYSFNQVERPNHCSLSCLILEGFYQPGYNIRYIRYLLAKALLRHALVSHGQSLASSPAYNR